jgi:hypothetical protein
VTMVLEARAREGMLAVASARRVKIRRNGLFDVFQVG